MKRMLNLSVLALAVVLLAGVQLSLAPGDAVASPYGSSLSDSSVGTTQAPGCENKGCSAGSKGTRRCKISKPGVNCSTDSSGRCAETAC
jgi:hypothetical protein